MNPYMEGILPILMIYGVIILGAGAAIQARFKRKRSAIVLGALSLSCLVVGALLVLMMFRD